MNTAKFIKQATNRLKKQATTPESSIEKRFVDYAFKRGCKALKLVYLNQKGFPDRTVLCPDGTVFFIEFKRLGKKQSATQKSTQALLEAFNLHYHVCDNVISAKAVLDSYLNRQED